MCSANITIDANEGTSYTATTPAVIDTSHDDVATGNQIRIDCNVAGTGTKGGDVILSFRKP
jgi:fibrillarin-like rRNA methylase